jgi:hypothetical protein
MSYSYLSYNDIKYRSNGLFRGFFHLSLLPDDLCQHDAHLVEDQEGGGHHDLRDDIRGGEDSRDDEDPHDHISPVAGQHPGIDHAELGEEEDKEGKLKDKAEGKEEYGTEGEVFFKRWRRFYKIRGKAHEKLEAVVKDDEIAEGGPAQEEEGREDDKGYGIALFMTIEGRRHEEPRLIEDYRGGHEYPREEGDLQIGEKRLGESRVDHARPGGEGLNQGDRQKMEYLFGKDVRNAKAYPYGDEGYDQSLAELFQVFYEGLFLLHGLFSLRALTGFGLLFLFLPF